MYHGRRRLNQCDALPNINNTGGFPYCLTRRSSHRVLCWQSLQSCGIAGINIAGTGIKIAGNVCVCYRILFQGRDYASTIPDSARSHSHYASLLLGCSKTGFCYNRNSADTGNEGLMESWGSTHSEGWNIACHHWRVQNMRTWDEYCTKYQKQFASLDPTKSRRPNPFLTADLPGWLFEIGSERTFVGRETTPTWRRQGDRCHT